MREGPNFFISYYKGSSRCHRDAKETWRTLGSAKFTDSGKALKEWCLSMDEQFGNHPEESEEGRPDTSFASEAIKEEEPNDNTKMIT